MADRMAEAMCRKPQVLWFFSVFGLATVAGNPSLRGSGTLDGPCSRSCGSSHVIVFDAGSSGTRIHVFNVLPATSGAAVPGIDLNVREAQTLKVKPGLSHYALGSNFVGAQDSIQSLLEFANKLVPPEMRAATPVLLKATAGLRAVPADKAVPTLQGVRQVLAGSGYKFHDEWASIIPGKEEGGLAWVAANYLQGTFGTPSSPGSGGAESPQSVGVIEMGGGSSQVTFRVAADQPVADEDLFVFKTLQGEEYRLYAHSYLGFGQDHAQARFREERIKGGSTPSDPCYQVGYKEEPFEGSGDALACMDMIKSTLLLPSTARGAPGVYANEVPLRGHFVATENFAHSRKDASLPVPAPIASVAESAKAVCSRPRDEQTPDKTCFAMAYQAAFLDALNAPRLHLSGDQVEVVRQVGGAEVDWAVGAAIVHAISEATPAGADVTFFSSGFSQVFSYERLGLIDSSMWVGDLAIFAVLCTAVSMAARWWLRRQASAREKHAR